jgi:hypothetical protein
MLGSIRIPMPLAFFEVTLFTLVALLVLPLGIVVVGQATKSDLSSAT